LVELYLLIEEAKLETICFALIRGGSKLDDWSMKIYGLLIALKNQE